MRTVNRTIVFFVVALVAFVAAARTPGSRVGVVFDRTQADFGNVYDNSGDVTVRYVMKNTGSGAVAILSARASCGCTEPSYPRKPVMPGDSAVVCVTFRTAGQSGEIDKEVTLRLRSAGGKSEKVQLVLRGVVIPSD